MNETVICVSQFCKRYGDFVAVDDISFQVRRGEIFGLLGPNGAGKSSTLECLEGLRRPDGGTLDILGVDPTLQPRRLHKLIGVQLQVAGLPATMTAQEAMRFFSAYHNVAPRYDLLERLGLGKKLDSQYHELSTGLKRRLALALAVAHQPQVLFLDEPTAGLDVASRTELHTLMQELRDAGTTIILATHDMAEVEKMTDRVAILLRGKIVASGSPRELTATGEGFTKVSVRTEGAILTQDGVSFPAVSQRTVKEDYAIYFSTDPGPTVAAILEYVGAQNDKLIDLRVERPSLEERFLEITTATDTNVGGVR
jgi:ABC-2 type transport system ATP-binding protein